MGRLEVRQGAQISPINAEDNVEEHLDVVRDMVVVMMTSGVLEDVEDSDETLVGGVPLEMEGLLTILCVTSVGFVAIWYVTVPVRLLNLKEQAGAPLLEVY